jgi:hypothetical protein
MGWVTATECRRCRTPRSQGGQRPGQVCRPPLDPSGRALSQRASYNSTQRALGRDPLIQRNCRCLLVTWSRCWMSRAAPDGAAETIATRSGDQIDAGCLLRRTPGYQARLTGCLPPRQRGRYSNVDETI